MSTFGKKYLRKWDYFNHTMVEKKRFNYTPIDFQLELLKKWYPIGMRVHKVNIRSNYPENDVHTYGDDIWTIIEHVRDMGHYMVRIKSDDEIFVSYPGRTEGYVFDNRHALNVLPIKEELRDMKLEKLLL